MRSIKFFILMTVLFFLSSVQLFGSEISEIKIRIGGYQITITSNDSIYNSVSRKNYFHPRKIKDTEYKIIQKSLIDSLVNEITKPDFQHLTITNLGFDSASRDSLVDKGCLRYINEKNYNEFEEIWYNSLDSEEILYEALKPPKTMPSMPSLIIELEVKFLNNDIIYVTSHKRNYLGFPWSITDNNKTYISYNIHINNILSNIISKDNEMYYLLTSENIETRLLWAMNFRVIKDELDSLLASTSLGNDKYILENEFEIVRFGNPYGNNVVANGSNDYWEVILRKNEFPDNFQISWLFNPNPNRRKIDSFLHNYESYLNMFFANQWITQMINEYPNYIFTLKFKSDISLDYRFIRWDHYREDYVDKIREDVVMIIDNRNEECCYFTVKENVEQGSNYSNWILLPNQRFLLWRHRGNTVLNIDYYSLAKTKKDKHRECYYLFDRKGNIIE